MSESIIQILPCNDIMWNGLTYKVYIFFQMERGKAWRPKNDENLWNGCDKFVFGKCEEYGLVK